MLSSKQSYFIILETLSSHLQQEDHSQFTCGPWIQDSCRRFLTNFTNMWSPASCFADLRVVMELLLRIHLCPARFFNPKVLSKDKKKKVKNKKPASKSHAISKLFWALVAKIPKKHIIDFFFARGCSPLLQMLYPQYRPSLIPLPRPPPVKPLLSYLLL